MLAQGEHRPNAPVDVRDGSSLSLAKICPQTISAARTTAVAPSAVTEAATAARTSQGLPAARVPTAVAAPRGQHGEGGGHGEGRARVDSWPFSVVGTAAQVRAHQGSANGGTRAGARRWRRWPRPG